MKIEFEFESQIYTAVAENIRGRLWIHFQGATVVVEESKRKFTADGSSKLGSGEIVAPMPGKVTKILKQVGDQVIVGEPIMVMEAMKMEYTLKADLAGSVEKLFCALNDQVPLGKKLAFVRSKA